MYHSIAHKNVIGEKILTTSNSVVFKARSTLVRLRHFLSYDEVGNSNSELKCSLKSQGIDINNTSNCIKMIQDLPKY